MGGDFITNPSRISVRMILSCAMSALYGSREGQHFALCASRFASRFVELSFRVSFRASRFVELSFRVSLRVFFMGAAVGVEYS